MDDQDRPACPFGPAAIPGTICYCTQRPGCPFLDDEPWDDELDEDADPTEQWKPVKTTAAFQKAGLL